MLNRRILLSFVFLALLVLFPASCAKHVSTLTPTQNLQLSVDQGLNVIAHSTRIATQSAKQLNASKVLSDSLTREILAYDAEVDNALQKAQVAATSAQTPQQRTAAVIAALQTIKQLPAGLQTFINNPTNQGEVVALAGLVSNVVSLVQALTKGGA